ncbi:TPA: helix-turn-helix transcriptional regulator [Proteus mirabilis]|uniref:helix-turn-helix domain-containing protein n=1 Tax=Proteus TaxID=583 RepID=UPI0008DDED88|nr:MULTISPECIES: helix-turn-helix transcriptional regulator [Proteus]EHF3471533.1 helix-turn-helix transcriptional regulator [Proteus mirabilis]EKW0395113.1 helix-turn-helix transcriptional regulator [Proteus mirabilis]EKW8263187.1 helix-turn-helix transcriptional regulator [Proteus mirabilis]EKW8270939.1 helix-turn-helix transcriptional regulator [Proteus mirabilis]EKX7356849.1 helix-turn-helix transcriptional regulator [Proteus mirabilis]
MDIASRIKAIRNAEKLSQSQFCEIMDMPISTLKKIEGGHNEPGWVTLEKITNHPRFSKYTLWIMTGKSSPEAGQISPALAHSGQEKEISSRSDKKIG